MGLGGGTGGSDWKSDWGSDKVAGKFPKFHFVLLTCHLI